MNTMIATMLLLLHAVNNAGASSGFDSCGPHWVNHGSSCFRVYANKMDYADAKGLCKMQDARIVQPKDGATNTFLVRLRNHINRTLPIWIGLTSTAEEDGKRKWVWDDGEPLEPGAFSNWAGNDPNDCCPNGEADCVRMVISTEAEKNWKDYSCTARYGVICEKPMEWRSAPTSAVMQEGTCNAGETNIARSRTATQSSTAYEGVASRAVDGDRSSWWSGGSCTRTRAWESNPWWRVDLGNTKCVNRVVVVNRGDCCSERLEGFQVYVGDNSNVVDNPSCGGAQSEAGRDVVFNIDCGGLTGRYVGITLRGWRRILTLCEVEVYGGIPMEKSTARPVLTTKQGVTLSIERSMEQPTSTSSTKPGNPTKRSTPRSVLTTKPVMTPNVDTVATTSNAVQTLSPPTDSAVIASINVSLTLTAPRQVNKSSLGNSIRQSLKDHAGDVCLAQCKIGEIFLQVTDTKRARKKRQAGDEVQIIVTIQLIVSASQGGNTSIDRDMAEDLLQKNADLLRQLARSGKLLVDVNGKTVPLIDNSDEKKKTPQWVIGVICAAVAVIIIVAVVTVLLCQRKHNPDANMPGKSGNEMKNLDTPERHDHTTGKGSVDNIIYNTEDEGFVDNVIYNAGDDGTVDNAIYQGQDSTPNDPENAPESQYESVY